MPSGPESALLCDLAVLYIPSCCQLVLYFYPTYLQPPGLKRSLCYCFLANTLFNGKRLSNGCCQVHPGLYGTKYLFLPLHKQPLAVFHPAAWESELSEGWLRQARSCPTGSGPASWCRSCLVFLQTTTGASQPAGKARAQAALTPGRGGYR